MLQNFSEETNQTVSPAYFAPLAEFSTFSEAALLTKAHRMAYPDFARGFVLDIKTVKALLDQNGGNISGIRIYLGMNTNKQNVAVAVSTTGDNCDDFGIPVNLDEKCNLILGEPRPCPSQCGKDNALNSDSLISQ